MTDIPTQASLEETKINMDTIDEFVSSENDTLVDQYGKTRKTLNGVEGDADSALASIANDVVIVEDAKDSAIVEIDQSVSDAESYIAEKVKEVGVIYDDPIRDWSASLLVEDLRAHRNPDGVVVIPVVDLPFTTGAEYDENNWAILQDLTNYDIINDLSQTYDFATVAEFKASSVDFPDGKTIHLNDRGAKFTIATGTGTGNNLNIIDSTVTGKHITLSEGGRITVKQYGIAEGVDQTAEFAILKASGIEFEINKGLYYDSDTTGQVVYFGDGIVYKPLSTIINTKYIKAFSGDSDSLMCPMSGILRQDSEGSGFYWIDDSGHRTNGMLGEPNVKIDDDYILETPFSYVVDEIGSFNITPDEYFSKAQIWVGPSVNSVQSFLFAYRDAIFTVNNLGSVTAQDFFGSTITASVAASGVVTVTHPPVLSAYDRAIATPKGNSSGTGQVVLMGSTSETSFTYTTVEPISGYVYHNGSAWVVDTKAITKPVVTTDSGKLTLTHSNRPAGGYLNVSGRGEVSSMPFPVLNNETTTTVVFKDFTGAIIDPTTNPELCRFYYVGSDMVRVPPNGDVTCMRNGIGLRWDSIYGTSGNFWIGGSMQPTRNI